MGKKKKSPNGKQNKKKKGGSNQPKIKESFPSNGKSEEKSTVPGDGKRTLPLRINTAEVERKKEEERTLLTKPPHKNEQVTQKADNRPGAINEKEKTGSIGVNPEENVDLLEKDRKEDNVSGTPPKHQREEDSEEESETETGESQNHLAGNTGLPMDNDLQDTSMEVDEGSELEGEGKRSMVNLTEWGANSDSDQDLITTEPTIPHTGTARLTRGVQSEEDDEEKGWTPANPPPRGNKQRRSERNNGIPPSFAEFDDHPLQWEENEERNESRKRKGDRSSIDLTYSQDRHLAGSPRQLIKKNNPTDYTWV